MLVWADDESPGVPVGMPFSWLLWNFRTAHKVRGLRGSCFHRFGALPIVGRYFH
jgi:hypothetical protein